MIMAPDAAGVIKRVINFTWKGICSKRSQPSASNAEPTSPSVCTVVPSWSRGQEQATSLSYLKQHICCLVFMLFSQNLFKSSSWLCKTVLSDFQLWGGADVTSTTQVTVSELRVVFIPCTELSGNEGFVFPGLVNSSFKTVPTLHLQE